MVVVLVVVVGVVVGVESREHADEGLGVLVGGSVGGVGVCGGVGVGGGGLGGRPVGLELCVFSNISKQF